MEVGGWTIDFVAAGTVVVLSLLVVYGAKEGSMFNIGARPQPQLMHSERPADRQLQCMQPTWL